MTECSSTITFRDSCFSPRGGLAQFSSPQQQFRILVMHLFMDDLSMEDIERFFFIYNLPARLRDAPGKLRTEVLTYIQHQDLIKDWSRNPSCLQELLKELGRAELAAKVEEFMLNHPSLQNGQQFYHRTSLPVNLPPLTNTSSLYSVPGDNGVASCQDLSRDGGLPPSPHLLTTEVHAKPYTKEEDCNGVEKLSPAGTVDDYEPVARRRQGGNQLKARRRQQVAHAAMTNWLDKGEELLDKNTIDSLQNRVSFTTSEATSSGYWSTRSSGARYSQLSVANSDTTECGGSVVSCESDDCGSILNLDWTSDFISLDLLGKEGSMSSVSSSLYNRVGPPIATAAGMDYQQNDSQNRNLSCSTSHCHGDEMYHVSASNNNCKDSTLKRDMNSPAQNNYSGEKFTKIFGELQIKSKTLLKSIDTNSQIPFTSEEFPSLKDYQESRPRYELRLYPTNFGKESVSLYIDLAQSYVSKKVRSKEVEIPAMDVSVMLYKCHSNAKGAGDIGGRCEIATVSVRTERQRINCSRNKTERAAIVSFPQLVSHKDLNLSKTEPHSTVMVTVEMKMDRVGM